MSFFLNSEFMHKYLLWQSITLPFLYLHLCRLDSEHCVACFVFACQTWKLMARLLQRSSHPVFPLQRGARRLWWRRYSPVPSLKPPNDTCFQAYFWDIKGSTSLSAPATVWGYILKPVFVNSHHYHTDIRRVLSPCMCCREVHLLEAEAARMSLK